MLFFQILIIVLLVVILLKYDEIYDFMSRNKNLSIESLDMSDRRLVDDYTLRSDDSPVEVMDEMKMKLDDLNANTDANAIVPAGSDKVVANCDLNDQPKFDVPNDQFVLMDPFLGSNEFPSNGPSVFSSYPKESKQYNGWHYTVPMVSSCVAEAGSNGECPKNQNFVCALTSHNQRKCHWE